MAILNNNDLKTHNGLCTPVPSCIHKEQLIHPLNTAKFGVEYGSFLVCSAAKHDSLGCSMRDSLSNWKQKENVDRKIALCTWT